MKTRNIVKNTTVQMKQYFLDLKAYNRIKLTSNRSESSLDLIKKEDAWFGNRRCQIYSDDICLRSTFCFFYESVLVYNV
jgi:hypothetical protein